MAHSSKEPEIEKRISELLKNTTLKKLTELQKRYGAKLLDKVFKEMVHKKSN